MAEDQQPRSDDELVAALRAQFAILVERLTSDIEPAPVYAPYDDTVNENQGE